MICSSESINDSGRIYLLLWNPFLLRNLLIAFIYTVSPRSARDHLFVSYIILILLVNVVFAHWMATVFTPKLFRYQNWMATLTRSGRIKNPNVAGNFISSSTGTYVTVWHNKGLYGCLMPVIVLSFSVHILFSIILRPSTPSLAAVYTVD